LLSLVGAPAAAEIETATAARGPLLHLELLPRLLGYGFPDHPEGSQWPKEAGTIGRGLLVFRPFERVGIEAGVLARLPFALKLSPDVGALPILSVVVQPFEEPGLLTIRFGSLDIRHGHHAALLDEVRYAYGRPYQATYNQSLVPEAHRDLGGDPFMPAEHGVQVISTVGIARVEGYLDWQLLETASHREKFAVGLLGELIEPWFRFGLQFRLLHYGGAIFTASDPLRSANLDPVRQPIAGAVLLRLLPLEFWCLSLELPAAYVRGRLAQTPGAEPSSQGGFETGADLVVGAFGRIGYRAWLPIDRAYGYVSEDSDPIYSGRRSHRVLAETALVVGPARLVGRAAAIFADQAHEVQYELLSAVEVFYDRPL
jgi:hypothetical protein